METIRWEFSIAKYTAEAITASSSWVSSSCGNINDFSGVVPQEEDTREMQNVDVFLQ